MKITYSYHTHALRPLVIQGGLLQAILEELLRILFSFVVVNDGGVCRINPRELCANLTSGLFGCWRCHSAEKGVTSPLHHPLDHGHRGSRIRHGHSRSRKRSGGRGPHHCRQSVAMYTVAAVAVAEEIDSGRSVVDNTYLPSTLLCRNCLCQGHWPL